MRSSLTARTFTAAACAAACALVLAACGSSSETDTMTTTTPTADTMAPTTSTAGTMATTIPAGTTTTPMTESGITITDAWARAVPGEDGMNLGAVYATITSETDDAIVSATVTPATVAEMVELHTVTADAGGEMSMQRVERIEVTGGTPTELKPGSYHIMLMGMPELPPVGAQLNMTIVFENAGAVNFFAPVREDTMPDMGDGHGG